MFRSCVVMLVAGLVWAEYGTSWTVATGRWSPLCRCGSSLLCGAWLMGQAELDVQYIMTVGANVPTWAFSTPGTSPTNPANEPFLAWLTNVDNITDAPNVFSGEVAAGLSDGAGM